MNDGSCCEACAAAVATLTACPGTIDTFKDGSVFGALSSLSTMAMRRTGNQLPPLVSRPLATSGEISYSISSQVPVQPGSPISMTRSALPNGQPLPAHIVDSVIATPGFMITAWGDGTYSHSVPPAVLSGISVPANSAFGVMGTLQTQQPEIVVIKVSGHLTTGPTLQPQKPGNPETRFGQDLWFSGIVNENAPLLPAPYALHQYTPSPLPTYYAQKPGALAYWGQCLDENLPPALRMAIIAALTASEQPPMIFAILSYLAAQAGYPMAAACLHQRA